MEADPPVLTERRGRTAIVRLNRPDNRNSMTPELLAGFGEALRALRAAPEVRCVVVTGTGRCFSAGADFRSAIQAGTPDDGRLPSERSYALYEPFLSVLDLEVPVLAAMNGHAIGGGLGLALLCDVRVASVEARLGATFAKLGIHPGLGMSYLLPRLVGAARAAELLFTGRTFTGAEAAAMGLVSEAVPADEVLPRVLALADDIARSAPQIVRATKRALYAGLGWDVRAAARREALAQAESVATEDAREGIAALLEKRAPEFRGR